MDFLVKYWAGLLWVGLLCLVAIGGCIDRIIEQQPPANPIRSKHYSGAPLSHNELSNLLDMATYNGSPDKYGELTMRVENSKSKINHVVFSHLIHRAKYSCRVCHLELEFSMKSGTSDITMEDNRDGRFCGACHDGVTAFSTEFSCNLCHVVPSKGVAFASSEYEHLVEALPGQDFGDKIDWVAAVKEGSIKPAWSLYEDTKEASMPLPEHLKKPMQWYTNVPRVHVSFSHLDHTLWLDCANCHPDIFKIESFGTEEFDKEKNLYGLYCGMCHMNVAFPMNACGRCHPGKIRALGRG